MKSFRSYLVTALLTALCCACTPKGVIPKDDLSQIYAEMFILDQKLSQQTELRRMLDTTRVYEHIFNKYGYTTEDYIYSLDYYIKNPNRHKKVLKQTQTILEDEKKALLEERQRVEDIEYNERMAQELRRKRAAYFKGFVPRRHYRLDSLRIDTTRVDTLGLDAGRIYNYVMAADTVFVGPRAIPVADFDKSMAEAQKELAQMKAKAQIDTVDASSREAADTVKRKSLKAVPIKPKWHK